MDKKPDVPVPVNEISVNKSITNLLSGVTKKGLNYSIQKIGDFLGVETRNKNAEDVMTEFTNLLKDPQKKEKLIFLFSILGKYSETLLKELKPTMKEAVNEMIEIGTEAIDKIIYNGQQVLLNAIGTIPGIGEVEEGIRVFFNLLAAFIASGNAGAKTLKVFSNVVSKTDDSLIKAKQEINNKFAEIKAKQEGVLSNIQKSVGGFYNSNKINKKNEKNEKNEKKQKTKKNIVSIMKKSKSKE